MLAGHFDGKPRPDERGRMVIYKAMCDLLWTLWGLIRDASGNPADDFWAYANNRFLPLPGPDGLARLRRAGGGGGGRPAMMKEHGL